MTGQTNFLQSLGWAVLNSLWQLALLWVAYQVITAFHKKGTSAFKSSLASGLLIAGFTWFVYTFFSVFTSSETGEAVMSSLLINTESGYPINDWLQKGLPLASVIYLLLLIMPLLRFIRNYRYVQVIRQYGLTKINVEWKIFVNNVSNRMGIKKPVSIWISELVSSPVTIGFLKPVILVPMAAINHLTPQQLEAVLLHELSHIKRYDYLVNLVINFIRTILYFNPFVKAFVKIVEQEREKTCDDMVLQFQYDSHEYATALLMLEKTNHLNKPLIVGSVGNKNDLLHRVELIMGVNKKNFFSFNKMAGLLAGLFCIIGLNVLLALNEQRTVTYAASSFAQLPTTLIPYTTAVAAEEEDKPSKEADEAMNEQLVRIQNSVAKLQPEKIADAVNSNRQPSAEDMAAFASFELPVLTPELKKYQEQQVKQALEASKKVLTSQQWKEVEKNIADVFTQKEKEELKSTYQQEISKFDWKQWENKLKVAYDKIDWEKVNYQLSYAVNQVRMDSLQVVYNKALSKLDMMQQELNANNITGIPDTDITLKEVELKKKEAQQALNNLRAIRSKKVVRL
jgi:bla regulator protein blaR1